MPLLYSLFIAFSIGLLSTLHCLGMCSGIIGALTFSLPSEAHGDRRRLLPYIMSYNAGRIGSYTLAGGVVSAMTGGLFTTFSPVHGHTLLRWLAALVLLVIGLYLAGWFPSMARVERIGQPVWRRLEPLGRRLLPVRSPLQAFLFGAVWGWLPCGLVYTTLLWTASSASAQHGALLMLAFGLGTLPTVVTAGILSSGVVNLSRLPHLRRGAGILLILMAVASLLFGLQPHAHQYTNNDLGRHSEHGHVE